MADEVGERGGQGGGGQGRSVSTAGAKYSSLTCEEGNTEHGKLNEEHQVIYMDFQKHMKFKQVIY